MNCTIHSPKSPQASRREKSMLNKNKKPQIGLNDRQKDLDLLMLIKTMAAQWPIPKE